MNGGNGGGGCGEWRMGERELVELMGRGAELSVPLFLGEEAKRMLVRWREGVDNMSNCG